VKANKKSTAALCGAAALLLALSACGGDSTGKKQDDWAKGVCDQVGAQTKKINDANAQISKVDSGGKPADLKAADSTAFQSISDAYKSLASIFTKAGPAPGDDGAKFQQNAVSAFNNLSSQYAALKTKADALDTSSQTKFAQSLKGVSDALAKTVTGAETSLNTLREGDMGKALAKQPGCQATAPSGSASPSPS
jgi:putative intracellular protease/amidase